MPGKTPAPEDSELWADPEKGRYISASGEAAGVCLGKLLVCVLEGGSCPITRERFFVMPEGRWSLGWACFLVMERV